MKIISDVKQFQRSTLHQRIQDLRDKELFLEKNLGDFLHTVQRALPPDYETLSSLKEFKTDMTVAIGVGVTGMEKVKLFLSSLDFLQSLIAQLEAHVYFPLLLIPVRCESEKQRDLKMALERVLAQLQALVKPTSSLSEVKFKQWEMKLLPRERKLFMGLISVIPLGLKMVIDFDDFIDEYFDGFSTLRPTIYKTTVTTSGVSEHVYV